MRRRRYLAEHVVFATHFSTFVLVYVPAILLPQRALIDWLEARGARIVAGWVGASFALTVSAGLYAYLVLALRRAYGDRWPLALLRAAVVLAVLLFGGGILFYAAVTAVTARSL